MRTRNEIEDGAQTLDDLISLRKLDSPLERDPCSLIFSITALDLFVRFFLNFSLQNSRSGRLVEPRSFQDVCGIDPVVLPTSHDMFFEVHAELEFIDRNLPPQ